MDYPSGQLESSIGKVRFAHTNADHVFLGTEHNTGYVTVRGVQYHVGLHLYRVADNWQTNNHNDLYLSRPNEYSKTPSDAARKTVEKELRAAWIAHLEANPESCETARHADVSKDIARLSEEIAELETTLAAKKSELKAKQLQLLPKPRKAGAK